MPTRPRTFNPHAARVKLYDAAKGERDAFYSSARWMALRKAFLGEHPLCEDCEGIATIAHHKQERLARPDLALDWDNLMALCNSCHSKRHKGK